MNALILINKPVDLRSTKCVSIAKKKLGGLKVGHAGTLDSTASGLLILLAGNATRLCEFVMSLPKTYRTVIQFGAETDTYDYSGSVIRESGIEDLDMRTLNDALFSFSGMRLQCPPAVSAIKIDGKPAHKLARSGVDVKIDARPVYFRNIRVIESLSHEGTIELEVQCGRGTYIRSLAHDLGVMTSCGAYVKSLERISAGNFHVNDANNPDDEKYTLIRLSELAKNFSRVYLSPRDAKTFINGMAVLSRHAEYTSRGIAELRDYVCVEGDDFLGFGAYAGYEYIRPLVIVPKDFF